MKNIIYINEFYQNTMLESFDRDIPEDLFTHLDKSHRMNVVVDKLIQKKVNRLSSSMFDENVPVISEYTKDSFPINTDLWNYKLKGLLRRPSTLKTTNDINNELYKKSIANDTTVYSGIRNEFKVPQDGIVHIPSFISTSLSPKIANDFSDLHDRQGVFNRRFLRIHLPKGSVGSYVDNLSNDRREHELLLPSNRLLKIDTSPKEFHYSQYDTPHKTTMYDARLMTDDEIESNKDHPEVQSYLRMKDLLK